MKTMAETILEHRITRTGHCSCGHVLFDMSPERIANHVADALTLGGFGPVREAQNYALREAADAFAAPHIQAQALREAAEAAEGMHDPPAPDCQEWADWLRARADRLEGK